MNSNSDLKISGNINNMDIQNRKGPKIYNSFKKTTNLSNKTDEKNIPNIERIDNLLEKVNKEFKIINKQFSYSIHEGTERVIVTIKDSETGEVIKEIPSEESLDFFEKMLEMVGLLIDEKS